MTQGNNNTPIPTTSTNNSNRQRATPTPAPVPTNRQAVVPGFAPYVSPTGRGWCLWRDVWGMQNGTPTPCRLEVVAPVVAGPGALADAVAVACGSLAGGGLDAMGAPAWDLPHNVGLHLTQIGTQPRFDDPRNRRGGHFGFRTTKPHRASDQWWQVCCRLLDGTYNDPARIVLGASIVRKPQHSSIKVWIAETSMEERHRQRQALLDLLRLPTGRVKFSPHRCILQGMAHNTQGRASGSAAPPLPPAGAGYAPSYQQYHPQQQQQFSAPPYPHQQLQHQPYQMQQMYAANPYASGQLMPPPPQPLAYAYNPYAGADEYCFSQAQCTVPWLQPYPAGPAPAPAPAVPPTGPFNQGYALPPAQRMGEEYETEQMQMQAYAAAYAAEEANGDYGEVEVDAENEADGTGAAQAICGCGWVMPFCNGSTAEPEEEAAYEEEEIIAAEPESDAITASNTPKNTNTNIINTITATEPGQSSKNSSRSTSENSKTEEGNATRSAVYYTQ